MKLLKTIAILGFAIVSGGFLFAGGAAEKESDEGNAQLKTEKSAQPEIRRTVTLTDCNGKEVTLAVPVTRAAVLNSGNMLGVVKAVNAEDKVIAVLDSIKEEPLRYPYYSELANIGTTDSPNYEAIVSLDPDIIIVPYWITDEVEEKLSSTFPVFRLNVGPPLTYKEEVEKIGIIFGKEDNAAAYISWYEKLVESVTDRTEGLTENEKPKVFDFYGGDWGMSAGPPYGTYGEDNFWVAPMIDMAGGINISGNLPGDWMTVDPEWVIAENPDLIIREVFGQVSGRDVTGYNAEDNTKLAGMRDDLIYDSVLGTTNSVTSGNVYMVEGLLFNVFGLLGFSTWLNGCIRNSLRISTRRLFTRNILISFSGLILMFQSRACLSTLKNNRKREENVG